MLRRKIPSLGALAAFESAARHQSFTAAADELAVTQSAVCRQIATLEDFVGVKLFRRTRRGVLLHRLLALDLLHEDAVTEALGALGLPRS